MADCCESYYPQGWPFKELQFCGWRDWEFWRKLKLPPPPPHVRIQCAPGCCWKKLSLNSLGSWPVLPSLPISPFLPSDICLHPRTGLTFSCPCLQTGHLQQAPSANLWFQCPEGWDTGWTWKGCLCLEMQTWAGDRSFSRLHMEWQALAGYSMSWKITEGKALKTELRKPQETARLKMEIFCTPWWSLKVFE